MVNMNIHPERMIFGQHVAHFLGNTHRHEDGHTRTDANNFDMRDLTQPAEDLFQYLWGQHQGIATGKQHITNLRRAFQIFDLHLEFMAREGLAGVSNNARTRAIATVRRALGRDQHENSVWIPMDQARHGRVAGLPKRKIHPFTEGLHFLREANDLPAWWGVWFFVV